MGFHLESFISKLQSCWETVCLWAVCSVIVMHGSTSKNSELEVLDLMLFRSILRTPNSTPKEMLLLELGVLPLRKIIRQRRLNFLKYVHNEDANSLIVKVFKKQCRDNTSKDWMRTVESDLKKVVKFAYMKMNLRNMFISVKKFGS